MKQNQIVIFFGVLAIAGAFGLGWKYGLRSESSPAAPNTVATPLLSANEMPKDVTNRRFEEMRREMDQMRGKLGLLEEQQRGAQANASKMDSPANVSDNANPVDSEALRAQEAQQVEAKQKFFKDAFQGEPTDPKWGGKAQTSLREAYSAATDKGVSLVDAECRSTMCRVTLSVDQPGPKGQKQLMETMNKRTPWPGYRNVHLDTTTGEVTMYMSREGATLPDWQSDSSDGEAVN